MLFFPEVLFSSPVPRRWGVVSRGDPVCCFSSGHRVPGRDAVRGGVVVARRGTWVRPGFSGA